MPIYLLVYTALEHRMAARIMNPYTFAMNIKAESKPVEINRLEVCQGPECREYGGPELLHDLNALDFPAVLGHCQGLCHFAPIVHINKQCIAEAKLNDVIKGLKS